MNRCIVALAVGLLFAAMPALATAEVQSFDAKAFEAAQAAGQGVVVDIHATW
jgi:hypothetical protein